VMGGEKTCGPYVLLASLEVLSPAPLAFELRYLAPCLEDVRSQEMLFGQEMELLD
jgi:hypothetical protein